MKYTIKLSKNVGTNLFDTIFVNVFEDESKWKKAYRQLAKALANCDLIVKTKFKYGDDFTNADLEVY